MYEASTKRMIMRVKYQILAVMACLYGGSALANEPSAAPSLQQAYADDFLIGTTLRGGLGHAMVFPATPREVGVMKREFNALTAENCMKAGSMQPREGEFFFEASDFFVDFAESNSMEMVGHTLVWHSQAPRWFFRGAEGQPADRDQMIERMRAHIDAVVGRYQGRIKYWDVVNEAVIETEDGKSAELRRSPWLQTVGEDYIELAFRFAHEADPEAKLYYNDYNMTKPHKVDFVVDMVSRLRAKGVPVHGVGIQGHWGLTWPALSDIEYALNAFAEAGIPVSITELDVTVLPMVGSNNGADVSDKVQYAGKYNPYATSIPASVLDAQAARYAQLFERFLKYRANIERVSFWGTSDAHSWKNDYPMGGRRDYPLLFDHRFNPKVSYDSLIRLSIED